MKDSPLDFNLEHLIGADPDFILAREVAAILGLSERWVEMLCKRGDVTGARKATDIEEIYLRRQKRIGRPTDRGVWLIPKGAVALLQASRAAALAGKRSAEKAGYPRGRPRTVRQGQT